MSYREVRGCFYSAARENETQSGLPSSETKYVSFRLVHDSADRKYRGSRWFGSPNYARPPHSDRSTPDLSGLYLSFRLVREAV